MRFEPFSASRIYSRRAPVIARSGTNSVTRGGDYRETHALTRHEHIKHDEVARAAKKNWSDIINRQNLGISDYLTN